MVDPDDRTTSGRPRLSGRRPRAGTPAVEPQSILGEGIDDAPTSETPLVHPDEPTEVIDPFVEALGETESLTAVEDPAPTPASAPLGSVAARPTRPRSHRRRTKGVVEEDPDPTLVDLAADDVETGTSAAKDPLERTAAQPAKQRRGIKWGRWLAAVTALLLVLAVIGVIVGLPIAENYARRTTNERISAALTKAFNTNATAKVEDPSVLRSLYRKRIDEVTFEAKEASFESGKKTLRFTRVNGTAKNITDPKDQDKAVLGELDANVLIGYNQVSELAGMDIKHDKEGRVKFDRPVKVFGATITVTVTAKPTVDPATRKITLQDPKARASAIPVPTSLLEKAIANQQEKLVLPDLPMLVYESIAATEEGMELVVSGRDVPLKALEKK